jgi:hypothetical protein
MVAGGDSEYVNRAVAATRKVFEGGLARRTDVEAVARGKLVEMALAEIGELSFGGY